ncbi:MAG TPA: hypothetical protein DDY13_03670 [Cytophagales bacterium]|jgi:ligand-binding sensor domain-containing protein|nr:hypothetical protein [Cytophagales bacterium]
MRLLYLCITTVLIALACSIQCFAQYQEKDLRFQHHTGQAGLSHQVVWAMMQDQQGFLWFGTEDGLNKYDGNNFEVFRHDRMDNTSIGDNFIYSLGEDHEGNIWVGTNSGGLAVYDRTKSKFYNFKHDPNDPKSIGDNRVYSIHQDVKGNMWIGTLNSGLNKFNFSDSSFTRYSYSASRSNSISSDVVFDIVEDSRGNLFVLTSNGIEAFDPEKGTFNRVTMPGSIQFSINTDYVHNLSIDA